MHFQSHHSDPSTTTVPTHSPSSASSSTIESSEYKAKLGSPDSSCDSTLSVHPQSSCLPAALQPFLETILHRTIGHANTGFELDHSPQADPHPNQSRKEAALDAIPRAFEATSPDTSMFELVQHNLFHAVLPSSNSTSAVVMTTSRGAELDGAKTGLGIAPETAAAGKEQSEKQSHRVFDQHLHQQQSPPPVHHHPHIIYPTTPCPSSTTTAATRSTTAQPSLTDPATPSLSSISVDPHAANSTDQDLDQDIKGHTKKTNAAVSVTPIASDTNNRCTMTDSRLGPVSSSSSSLIRTCNLLVDAQPSLLLGHLISATSAAPLQELRGDGSDHNEDGLQENGSTRQTGTATVTAAATARPLTQDKDDADNTTEPSDFSSLTSFPVPEMNKAQIDSQAQRLIRGEESFDEDEISATEDIDGDQPLFRIKDGAAAGGRKRGGAEGTERKRLSVSDLELSRKKRGKDQDLVHPLQFMMHRREDQRRSSSNGKGRDKAVSDVFSRHSAELPFDPVLFLSTWSSGRTSFLVPSPSDSNGICEKGSKAEMHRYCAGHSERSRHFQQCYHLYRNKSDRKLYTSTLASDTPQSRKRVFTEAIAISGPLGNRVKPIDHPDWVESVKRRKVHQYATRWTSRLSPSPYVKLLTVRDFWDLMDDRTDLSWRAEKDMDTDSMSQSTDDCMKRSSRQLIHHPCPTQFLKGLWEEEMMVIRKRQMIPDNVRKPNRSKVFNPKPLVLVRKTLKATSPPSPTLAPTPLPTEELDSPASTELDMQTDNDTGAKDEATVVPSQAPLELDLALKKKHRAAAIIRSHAITEGSDMAEYKPWKDGTVSPQQGSLQALKELRCHIMDPWPEEISKARDECTRVLHRMREQLNIVINLQIHLRSMIKTAPTHWSFLLSIRHPGQVSIELLLALYGPNFIQTSNFRAIEQLLWGNNKGGNASPSSASSSPSSPLPDSPSSSSTSPSSPESTVDQSTTIV
ncbi:hypothetical protein EMPS_11019 [Entomortierella parvispora]|uniref:Uncharacterized protein n=1 Tax=Entomortierella parvispora TaxID=205924 RepID=A0A9P3HKX7_9FUNG|nr:hypothetical protein EMPS_11019 [Entomortierella parvispora]